MSKITHITVNNIKRIRSVDVTPGTHLFVVGGRNEQGKSSFLDAIEMAFRGAKFVPSQPIRAGETEGEIVIELDDGFRIRQRHTASGATTTLSMTKDGVRSEIKSPQAMLNAMAGSLAIDPLQFARESPARQRETLRKLVGIDTGDLDKRREELFVLRTDVNRNGKDLRAQFDAMPLDADAPTEPVNTAELIKQLRDEEAKDRALADAIRAKEALEREFAKTHDEANDIRARILQLQLELKKVEDALASKSLQVNEATEAIAALPKSNAKPILERMESASEQNKRYEAAKRRAELGERLERMRAQSAELSTELDSIDAEKQAMIASAKFPVEGLGFSPDGITYNGIPFEQASSAVRIKVSLAIAAALAPKLRCCIIREGSLLDDDAMGYVASWAEANDMQIIMERVGTGDECSIVMHDGRLTEV